MELERPGGKHFRDTLAAVAAVALTLASTASAQFRMGHAPDDLAEYEWTAWLIGEWEGVYEPESGNPLPCRQSFQLSPDHKYILTHNQRGEGEGSYRGFGIFSCYPATNEAYGQWFGMMHDTNDGWARRDGERTIWTIRRLGMRITRTRTRVGADAYVVDNEVQRPDGRVTRSREIMRRVRE